jgi:hypothetical protein
MLINKLEHAEKIVKNFTNLRWVGWNIVERTETEDGFSNKYGSFVNNKWGIDRVYKVTEKGWHLPNTYGDKK